MISRVLGSALLLAGLSLAPVVPAGPASASGVGTVNVVNMRFNPAAVTVPIGASVTWRFVDEMTHNSTSSQGFWSSGSMGSGDTFVHTFGSSGSYAYLCTIHPSMRGVVNVPVSASGSPASGWSLRWSTAAGAGGTTFDIQVRKPGSSAWKPFRTDTTRPTAKFNPRKSGSYAVRARTTHGGTSGWSPAKSLRIS
jgi:plastocyanin